MTDEKQNEVSESKEIPHEINSISDLSRILQTLGEPEKGHTRFFRGHGDEGWQMLPSIYRENYLIKNEDKIIKDALTYCPDDFLPSDTLFEKLVKLQHYGYSTRLLDLTTNALVALYFSAWNKQQHEKDGELIILDIPDKQIKYGDSDTVTILSAISLRPLEFNILAPALLFDSYSETSTKKPSTEEYEKVRVEYFNTDPVIVPLLDDIRSDKPYFRPVINSEDLNCVLCVRAKLNNARISRQQGCFLLFGIERGKVSPAAIPNEWQPFASNGQKILVKAESKAAIMQELQSFGISKRTLFPELEAQATEIMEQYNPDSKKP